MGISKTSNDMKAHSLEIFPIFEKVPTLIPTK